MDMSADAIHNRRLRLLGPRPFPTAPTNNYSLHNPNIPSSIPPLGKREGIGGQPLASTRWNPTAEQVQALEEMYRQGIRTPSAEEIQRITAQLRRFGRIEGKNVFYWFQNHKARDRQRKRRQLVGVFAGESDRSAQIPPRKRSGSSKRHSENEHPEKLPTMSNCSTSSKNYESMYGGEVQELQHKITNEDKIPSKENTYYSFVPMCKQLTPKNDYFRSGIKENRTLELFPVRTNDLDTVDEETNDDGSSLGLTRSSPNQFFMFLPTKN